MASKFGMAGGVPERRVRPIWDAVDSRQFKSALKLSSSLLSKYPNSPYALALKALILERMGKPDEALSVCLCAKEHLCSEDLSQIDDLTLSTLQMVFHRLDRMELGTSCYEYACSKFPNNVELMTGLFNCYVREYSFVKQQQTAIKMYKIVSEERFLLWAVCSILLQVFCGNGGEKLLLLAEGLLKKHVASYSLHEPEALLVYLSVLEHQAKYGAALELVSEKFGNLLVIEVDRLKIQGKLLACQCDYAAAVDTFEKILQLCPDDWEAFLDFLGCLLEEDIDCCNKNASCLVSHESLNFKMSRLRLTEEMFDLRISRALELIQKLQKETSDDNLRCPYLAKIEIERRRCLYGKTDHRRLLEALLLFFNRFGHLACFVSDIRDVLQHLNPKEQVEMLDNFKSRCEDISVTPSKKLGLTTSVFKLRELLGTTFKDTIDDLEFHATYMVDLYCKNISQFKHLDPQENTHSEELLSLASNILVQLFLRTKNLGHLLEAILVLEFGLTIRSNVSQYKILLLHLYSSLNALTLAHEWYKTLDVKNILMETVSHHILPQMLKSSLWFYSHDLIKEYLKFMDDFLKEAADLTFVAYRHRNYSKVIEFVQFKEHLEHSHWYLMARIEALILQAKQKAENLEEVESVFESSKNDFPLLELSTEERCRSLTFNEDMQSRPWWSPAIDENHLLEPSEYTIYPRGNVQLAKEQRDKRKLNVIKRRSLLPRLIHLSIQSASCVIKDNTQSNGTHPDSECTSELYSLLEQYLLSLDFTFNDALLFIVDISEGKKHIKDVSDIVDWMNFSVFLNALNLSAHDLHLRGTCVKDEDTWKIVDKLIHKLISEKIYLEQHSISLPGRDISILEQIVTESLAWHSLIIQSCIRAMAPTMKKKKRGAMDQVKSPLSLTIQNSLRTLCNSIELVSKWLSTLEKRTEDEEMDMLLSLLPKDGNGTGKIIEILKVIASRKDHELGDHICRALESWNPSDVAKKIIRSQKSQLSGFGKICQSKLKSLRILNVM